jgi:hypothetical protein
VVIRRCTVVTNRGYVLQPFTVADCRGRVVALGVRGGAVMFGSFQADDQT